MASIHGVCDSRFNELKSLVASFISAGKEVGMSLTVNVDGKNLVDIWAGKVDESLEARDWEKDTITNVYSSSKTVVSLAALLLIDRGLLDPDAPVAKYWPEFGQNGKENVLVRHVLSHTSGLSGWEAPKTLESIYDWNASVAELAAQATWWEPGTALGYQSMTYGFLVGELVRRVTGKTCKHFVAEEIAAPLGADFQIGVADEDLRRVSDVILFSEPTEMPKIEPGSIAFKTFTNPPFIPSIANTSEWRHADLGAGNGHGNSSGLARILSVLALGGVVDGKQYLSTKTIDLIFEEQAKGIDQVVGLPMRYGLGYGLTGDGSPLDWLPAGRVCYWGGFGGSMVIADLDRRVTIAYAMNKLHNVGLGGERAEAYVKAIYAVLESM